MEVHGRCVVVTGGASGIGRGLVQVLLERGAKVVAADVDETALAQLGAELGVDGETLLVVRTDVTDAASVDALRDAALARFGRVDVIVLNAGVAPAAPLLATSLDAWKWVLDVNLFGVVHGLRSFVPGFLAQSEGQIVVTSSLAGLMPVPDLAAYTASKHAVVGLAEATRLELAGTGVEVTILCPGGVRTAIFRSERNRPESLGGKVPESIEVQRRLEDRVDGGGADPLSFAQEAVDAIEASRRWFMPDQANAGPLRRRLADVVADAAGGPPPS